MQPAKAITALFCLVVFGLMPAQADAAPTLKGLVIAPDGTVVPEFSVVVRRLIDAPKLIPRKHFRNGEFILDGLEPGKYQLQITSKLFLRMKLDVDFKQRKNDTQYRIIVLRPFRTEAQPARGETCAESARAIQAKIPDAARIAYSAGVALHREGQLEEALTEYGKAIRAYQQYPEALNDVGIIYLLLDRHDAALSYFRRAHEIDDCNPTINMNIAAVLAQMTDYGGALKVLKDVLPSGYQSARTHYSMAKIYYLQKKYALADIHLKQAIETDPSLIEAWVLSIDVNLELKNYPKAREGLRRIRDVVGEGVLTGFLSERLSTSGN